MSKAARRSAATILVALLALSAMGVPGASAQGGEGWERQPRVVGGKESNPGDWPSMAGLLESGRTDNFQAQFCGATVIARSWVLTAAHCLDRGFGEGRIKASELDVLVGTSDLTAGGERIRAREIRYVPSWDSYTLQNDLALIRLNRPTDVPHMPIIDQGRGISPGTPMITTGWGNQVTEGSQFPTKLWEVELPYVSDAQCGQIYGNELSAQYRAGIICAGRLGESSGDSCNGDSGGPLSARIGGVWTQVGIVSWGVGCANPEYPGIYTRLAKYSDWVKSQIRYGVQPDAASFVRQQYRDLYGRQPNSFELFSGVLTVGTTALSTYVDNLMSGPGWETNARAVARLYRAYFGRDPDLDGLRFWVDRMQRGGSIHAVSSSFAASSEFANTYGSLNNEQFVQLVYNNVLGRSSDLGGASFWIDQLDSAKRSRGRVMTGFSESNEYRRLTKARVDVNTTYFGLLRRLPTQQELASWMGKPNLDLVRHLLASYEYAARF